MLLAWLGSRWPLTLGGLFRCVGASSIRSMTLESMVWHLMLLAWLGSRWPLTLALHQLQRRPSLKADQQGRMEALEELLGRVARCHVRWHRGRRISMASD